MSKAIAGLLETAAGIALEFVPGGQAIGTQLIVAGVGTLAVDLLTNQPKPEQTQTAVKAAIPSRVTAYGKTRERLAFTA